MAATTSCCSSAVTGVVPRSVSQRFSGAGGGGGLYPRRMSRLRVAAAQLNLVVGDLEGNAARLVDAYVRAEAAGADLVAFPELAVTGYPPEDLLLRPAFVAEAAEQLEKVAARTGRAAGIVGFPESHGPCPYNAPAVLRDCTVSGVYPKH